MMTKKVTKLILRIALVLSIIATFTVSILALNKKDYGDMVFAESATANVLELRDSYEVKDVITFPNTTVINYGGEDYDGTYLGYQNAYGDIDTTTTFACNKIGKYQALYTFNVNGRTLIASQSFTVNNPLVDRFNGSSSVTYGELENLKKADVDPEDPSKGKADQGLTVDLADGDVFKFNKPINLKDLTADDLIRFFPQTLKTHIKVQNTAKATPPADLVDFQYLYFDLVDAYDPSIKVQLQFRLVLFSDSRNMTVATLSDQGHAALENANTASVTNAFTYDHVNVRIDGVRYAVWSPKNLQAAHRGTGIQSLVFKWAGYNGGDTSENAFVTYNCGWKYDYENSRVYYTNYSNSILVNDLDDPNITRTGVFGGFTTGEVYLSMYGGNYNASSTKIEIYSIGNYKGDDLKDAFAIDETAPVIKVEDKSTESNPYVALVNTPVTIPSATAFDPNLASGAKALVYFNYGASNQSLINVTDGKFIPGTPGDYTIEYSATDVYGNVGKETVSISVINNANNSKGIEFTPVNKLTTVTAGDSITLTEPAIISHNGSYIYDVKVIDKNGENVIVSVNPVNCERSFIPSSVGEYTITYTIEDSLYVNEYSYKFSATGNEDYFFTEYPYFQKYFIQNANYTIDDCFAYYNQNGELKSVLADLYVRFDDTDGSGEFTKCNNYKVKMTGNTKVEFMFKSGEFASKIFEGKIVDVDYKEEVDKEMNGISYKESIYKMQNYFVGDVDASNSQNGSIYATTKESGNATMEFINPILFSEFSLRFRMPVSSRNYSQINFYLTDIENENNVIKFSMILRDFNTYLSINDGTQYSVSVVKDKQFIDDIERSIKYTAATNQFNYKGSVEQVIPYSGNIPEKVYLSVEFQDLVGVSELEIIQINGQNLKGSKDNGRPSVVVSSAEGSYVYGTVVTLNPAIVGDVLSPVSIKDVKIKVTDQIDKSKVVYAEDGTNLSAGVPATKYYQLKLISDKYLVSYDGLVDDYGNKGAKSFTINVVDFEKPTVYFNDGSDQDTVIKVQLNSVHDIKAYTIADNKSSIDKMVTAIVIFNDYGGWETCVYADKSELQSKQYTAFRKGKFKVEVITKDEAGNFATCHYYIVVE